MSALDGRTAIVSGSSMGLGKAIARAYVEAGATVVLCARTEKPLVAAAEELRAARAGAKVLAVPCDVARPADVERLVAAALAETGRVDILVNNAGVQGPAGKAEEVPWDAWRSVIEANLLGSVLLAREVVPVMKRQRRGRIIQLSGGGAAAPREAFSAYAVSKAGAVRFAETLAAEVREFGILVNAIAPGALNTRFLDEVLAAGEARVGAAAYQAALRQQASGGAPLTHAVALALFLAGAGSDGITGKLISAAWDDWPAFPRHLEELGKSDVYTLRRIVAKDRGFDWGDK